MNVVDQMGGNGEKISFTPKDRKRFVTFRRERERERERERDTKTHPK